MKRIFKITGIVLGIIILLLILTPFIFRGTIEDLLKKNLNNNLNATVSWEDLDLSLFSGFPDAAVVVKNFGIINKEPFLGDTLASGDRLQLEMGITQLFKSTDEAIEIDAIMIDKALINIKVDSLGNANYDIVKQSEEPTNSSTSGTGFSFNLKHYEINNSAINYSDKISETYLMLSQVNHQGNGDLSQDISELKTKTNALTSLKLGDIEYLNKNSIALDAAFNIDLKTNTYTFLDNEAKINELPLAFNGFVRVNESSNEVDITFKTPSSNFKNFLAVIPKVYTKNLDDVSTTGDFMVDGMLKGTINETLIPTMDIKVKSNNASFKYPDLPKAVRNIAIDMRLRNETGLVKDTYLNIGGLTFKIDDEVFAAKGSIKNLTENALVNLALTGTINLANIERVLPLDLEQDLTGIFSADVTTNFDMKSVETEQYQNIRTNGTAKLTNFKYKDEAFKNEIDISEADVKMSPGNITLKKLNAKTGSTDVAATGSIQNLIPWIMAKQDLKGNFDVNSKTFNVNDFMTTDAGTEANDNATATTAETNNEEGTKIPDFLDATINFNAEKVIYDNLELKNTKGTVKIVNETAQLSDVTSSIFGGNIAFAGDINTQKSTPTFAMNLDLSKIDIDESFGQLSLLKYLAPVAKALDGNFNTTLKLNGQLNKNLTPDLSTLAGNAIAQILTAEVNPERTPILSKLSNELSFLNLDKLSLQDINTAFTFNNGKIEVKPFNFNVKGIEITASGSHGLDKSMSYNLDMDVPAKYLGSEITKLLSKLDKTEADQMTVQLPVGISGSFTQPKINLNTKAAVNELTSKIIQKQKETLIDKGTDILGGLLGGNDTPKDTTATETGQPPKQETTEVVRDILGGLFGKKKKKDSTDN